MRQTPATPAGSISIAEKVRVAVDWKAEPTDWDHAVARFLLATVRKEPLTATAFPIAAVSDVSSHAAADSALHASPMG
jgi:hypothetical protein